MVQIRLLAGFAVVLIVATFGVSRGQEPESPSVIIGDIPSAVEPTPGGIEDVPLDLPEPPGVQLPDDGLGLPPSLRPTPTEPSPLSGGDLRSPRTPAQQAVDQPRSPQFQGDPNVRLARAPKMLGDFFGNTQTGVVVGEFFGEAVHQTIASGSAFANNNISLITTDPGTGKTVFVGGPGGLLPESFFLPPIPPPLPPVVTDLTANGTDGTQKYTAVETSMTVDVFDNPADMNPSIPNAPVYNTFAVTKLIIPIANPGDLVGRVRIQDNNSAMPQDRFYFDYNYFHNVRFTGNGFGVNRFVPGIEKTFLDGLGSVEVRVPMAATLNSDMTIGRPFDTSNYQFGNVLIAPKLLLWASDEEAFAVGLGISLPTANDIQVFGDSAELLRVSNDSVHLIPYLGYLYAPRRTDYFVHCFLTLDVDTNGNEVSADINPDTDGLQRLGVLNDQTYLSASAALGKFVYRNCCRASRVQAVAWSTELHYTSTVNNADVIVAEPDIIGVSGADLSLLNGTVGAHVQLQKSIVTAGYTVPLTSNDRIFDGEFRLFINRPF